MSPRTRLMIGIIGITIVLCSLVALAFAFWPEGVLEEQIRLAPTLLTPP